MASWVDEGPGSRLHVATASSKWAASIQPRCSTHNRRSSLMCVGGPPKPMQPMRPHSRNNVTKDGAPSACPGAATRHKVAGGDLRWRPARRALAHCSAADRVCEDAAMSASSRTFPTPVTCWSAAARWSTAPGAMPVHADVRVRDGVDRRGRPGPGCCRRGTVIDADGAYVTPGLIESHTHFDAAVWWDADCDPMPAHGCTTMVLANCGLGLAPLRPAESTDLVDLFAFIEDIPAEAFNLAVPWAWDTWPEYFAAARAAPDGRELRRLHAVPDAAHLDHGSGCLGAGRHASRSATVWWPPWTKL